MSSTSCTTTNMKPGDNEAARAAKLTPIENNVLTLGVKPQPSGAADIPIIIKPVDRKTLAGSTPGDFRAQAAQPDMSQFINPPAPRQFTRPLSISGRTPTSSAAPIATEGAEVVGD